MRIFFPKLISLWIIFLLQNNYQEKYVLVIHSDLLNFQENCIFSEAPCRAY